MSQNTRLPSFDEVDAALSRCGAAVDVSELHGLSVGFLAGGGSLDGHDWLDRLHVDANADVVRGSVALQAMRTASLAGLSDQDMGFDLLLPDDEAALSDRVSALCAWCRGFLSGFALASPHPAPSSPEAQEILADLAEIAGFAVDEDESDEDALVEIIEFIRVAVLLIHGDSLRARCAPGTDLLH